jgi:hypothetical protein
VPTTLTYQNLLAEAREILQDVATDPTLQRYSDQTLVNIFNRGLQELYRLRPDAFYDFWDATLSDFDVPYIAIPTVPPPTPPLPPVPLPAITWTTTFGLPMMFYDALCNWVIGTTEAVDDEFSDDSRSTAFRAFFKQQVTSL